MSSFLVKPGGSLKGTLQVPGDKSVSHRSIIFGSLAQGITEVSGFLQGEDSLRTLQAFREMGVNIEHDGQGNLVIHGVGLHGLQQPRADIDLGNSGTAMRLMAGVLAGQRFATTLVGDESLSVRPMGRIIDPLTTMGAKISGAEKQRPPLSIEPASGALQPIDYQSPVASAQIKSCLLLAGLYADGMTVITEPGISRDHTERMLRGFGVTVDTEGLQVRLQGGQALSATKITVPSDISSSAFFLVGASIASGSDLQLRDVGMNPTRDGVIRILQLMGADIEIGNQRVIGGEPVADLRVRSAPLHGIDVPPDLVPLAIDEFPALFVAASVATGETRVSGAEELRVKETDRIQAMVDGLTAMGADISATEDGAVIRGRQQLRGATVDSYGDHRIAMSFAMAALRANDDVTVRDCENVNTSFPGFVSLAATAGLNISDHITGSAPGGPA